MGALNHTAAYFVHTYLPQYTASILPHISPPGLWAKLMYPSDGAYEKYVLTYVSISNLHPCSTSQSNLEI